MNNEDRATNIAEIAGTKSGAAMRLNALLESWQLGPEAASGMISDETGRCRLFVDLRGRPDLHDAVAEFLDGFVLGLRVTACGGGVALSRPEDILEVQRFLRPEHDLSRHSGLRVTLSGLVARVGWVPGSGTGLLMLSDEGPGAWIQYPYLEDPELLAFARQVDFTGFVAVRGTVRPLDWNPEEPTYPPSADLFRGVKQDAALHAVHLESATDIVLADPGERPPRYATDCSLGQNLGCQTLCCSLQVRLSSEELDRGLVHTELPGGIVYLRRESDGYCYAMDRSNGRCGVYEIRPRTCREFSCIHEASIVERMRRNGPVDHLRLFTRIEP